MPGVRGEVGALVEGTPVRICMHASMYDKLMISSRRNTTYHTCMKEYVVIMINIIMINARPNQKSR